MTDISTNEIQSILYAKGDAGDTLTAQMCVVKPILKHDLLSFYVNPGTGTEIELTVSMSELLVFLYENVAKRNEEENDDEAEHNSEEPQA